MTRQVCRPSDGALSAGRRSDLDWIRVGAFGLLILYHIALFYAPIEWHVNSRQPVAWVAPLLVMTNPWRLTLLFFISGAAVRLMSRSRTAMDLIGERSRRLLPPLLFGIAVLVPPQAYLEDVARGAQQGSYLVYWARYFVLDRGLCLSAHCSAIPLNHLWFIGYIWTYSVAAAVLFLSRPKRLGRLQAALGFLLDGPGLVILPVLFLWLARLFLFPRFGITNHLTWDWYNHTVSFGAFVLGLSVANEPRFWNVVVQWRRLLLGLAILAGLPLLFDAVLPGSVERSGEGWRAFSYAVNQWCAIAAILGFGHHYLRLRDGALLRYLSGGVFTFYLVHQPIIIVTAYFLDRFACPLPIEAALLIGFTVAGCLASYELARRMTVLRPLFGLRLPRPARA